MLKRICLFMAAISFSALYAINALAQSCDLAPTCAELGFTQTTDECSGKKTLICPFDKTAVFCGSSSDNGPFGSGSISFEINYKSFASNNKFSFEASGGDLWVDWGDGTFDKSNTHSYEDTGIYTIKIYGTITSFSSLSQTAISSVKILSLDLASITKMDLSGYVNLTGTIPNLPPNLVDGSYMFYSHSGLTGTIPALPDSLTNGERMFANCSGLSGSIPPLPNSLTNGEAMFNKSFGLTGLAPKKPDNLISYGGIFGFTSITNDGSWPDDAWFF